MRSSVAERPNAQRSTLSQTAMPVKAASDTPVSISGTRQQISIQIANLILFQIDKAPGTVEARVPQCHSPTNSTKQTTAVLVPAAVSFVRNRCPHKRKFYKVQIFLEAVFLHVRVGRGEIQRSAEPRGPTDVADRGGDLQSNSFRALRAKALKNRTPSKPPNTHTPNWVPVRRDGVRRLDVKIQSSVTLPSSLLRERNI